MIDRRVFLGGVGAVMTAAPLRAAPSRPTLVLWPQGTPSGGGPTGEVQVDHRGAITNIATPALEVFVPVRPTGTAVLVAAGGGYRRIAMENEAYPAAFWLASHGITAFVLSYRLPPEGWVDGPLAPLQDAQRALRLIRANATQYGIDPHRIGVLGFSAGGHLLGLVSTRSAFASYAPMDMMDEQSARADFAALIYPIITLQPPYDHTSTRQMLIGANPDRQATALWSVETHVHSGCPPMFLVEAEDDPIANPANTLIMAEACQRVGVPVELHRLASGGHGFGMGRPDTPSLVWPDWYATWLDGAAGQGNIARLAGPHPSRPPSP